MRYVALLRGINVGGNTMMKMDELKAVFSELGFENVTSYINSGNLAFDTADRVRSPHVSKGSRGEQGLVDALETAIEKKFGRHIDVMVRPQSDIDRVIANNPFEGEFESHKHMHVLFLKDELPLEKQFALSEIDLGDECIACLGREIYALLPAGVAESNFLRKSPLDKKPRVSYTGRNWRTVLKLATL
jgi:uncharacterized protein (DUF1697 family)